MSAFGYCSDSSCLKTLASFRLFLSCLVLTQRENSKIKNQSFIFTVKTFNVCVLLSTSSTTGHSTACNYIMSDQAWGVTLLFIHLFCTARGSPWRNTPIYSPVLYCKRFSMKKHSYLFTCFALQKICHEDQILCGTSHSSASDLAPVRTLWIFFLSCFCCKLRPDITAMVDWA